MKEANRLKQIESKQKYLDTAKTKIQNLEINNRRKQQTIDTVEAHQSNLKKQNTDQAEHIQLLEKKNQQINLEIESYKKINYEIINEKVQTSQVMIMIKTLMS